jgi:AcrR family transcriptional regulator
MEQGVAGSRPQRGRASSERALIEAAIDLFVEFGPNAVSVRAIADRAGVNHGLVHHYFGSKAALVRAAHEHLAAEAAEAISERGMAALLDPTDVTVRRNARLLARIVVDDALPDIRFPVMETLTQMIHERIGVDLDEARIRAAQVLALVSGWLLLESALAGPAGCADVESFRVHLAPAAVRLVTGT